MSHGPYGGRPGGFGPVPWMVGMVCAVVAGTGVLGLSGSGVLGVLAAIVGLAAGVWIGLQLARLLWKDDYEDRP